MAISPEKAAGTTTGHGHATRFIFLALGLAISAWAVLVPFAKARLGVNEAELGLLLLLVGTGAIISMPFAGWLTGKYGCRKTLVVSTTVFMLSLIGLAFVSSPWAFGLSLFMFGASSGVVDVGMNIQAILVEKERKRSMMSGLHGMYSVGGFFGALIISALLNLGLTPLSAILCLTISLIAGLLIMARYLFPYGHESKNRKSFSLPKGSILMLGVLCFIMYMGDGVVLDWGALFMTTTKSISADTAGLSFAIFSVAISIGRLFGDRLVEWLGIRKVMTSSGIIAAIGFVIVMEAPSAWIAFAGFVVVGLGAANLIPLLFTIASRQKKMPVPQAISSVTTLGYLGLLVGPAMMGFIAHATSLYVVFGIVAALMIFVSVTSRWLHD
ncbi:MFS transporter [Oxalobacter formigenes OXCC13]|uniref:Transporter, major facilitator family protein n=2 Tax=Oxalobacter formigenes TaxID=847 RepID=C3X9S2_OXAFO|nr:MFS transporter [Oxalobacter formigenes OXCC13]EEO29948.1 transporter, major facilitator family protein [Oxalobacter formigenes OXCC13]QDX34190.1 MFS transporter [Oxalobacter formigenes]